MKSIRVVLVDEHLLVREGLKRILKSFKSVEVVGEATDAAAACELLRETAADVVVLNDALPALHGLDALLHLIRDYPLTRLLVISRITNEEFILQAVRGGVSGFLLKDTDVRGLEEAIATVASGESYLSPSASQAVTDYVRRAGGESSPLDRLTTRQREILMLVAEGHSTKKIAQLLKITVKTVETHRLQLMERLGIHDVAGLVRYAIRVGIVVNT